MTPHEAIAQAKAGKVAPIYVVMGDEAFLRDAVIAAIRSHADTGVAGFNEDRFIAGEVSAEQVVAAALHLPMMARRRLVWVSGVERWDQKNVKGAPLDALAAYAAAPADTTVLIVSATKINGARKLIKIAKKEGFLVSCEPLARRELPRWARARAKELGHDMSSQTAEALAELAGPELSSVVDAIDRLSLYAGAGAAIGEDALAAVVTRVRQETVWALVDALADRHIGRALAALSDAYDGRTAGLPLLGAVTWRVRQLLKFQAALSRGLGGGEAAKRAGVPPFKASELERTVRKLPARHLERWLLLLAEADLALKGSRRSGHEVLATMLVDMCA